MIKSDNEIKEILKIRYNSAIFAREELTYWLEKRGGNMSHALASYNAGWKMSKGLAYARGIERKIKYLKQNPHLVK